MKIHRYAAQGNRAGVQQELANGVPIDVIDEMTDSYEPQTPLQCAIASPTADVAIVEYLLVHGATLQPADLHWAIRSGQIAKVRLLLEYGVDINYVDEHGYDALIHAMFSQGEAGDRAALVQFLIDQGAPVNGETVYGESALSVASRNAWFAVVGMLLRAGSDPAKLGWTDLMHAIALGSLAEVEAILAQGADLTARDRKWERTPWLLSIHTGDVAKANCLLDAGSDPTAVGHCGKHPLMYALESGNPAMLTELLDRGLDVNATDEFDTTALMMAVEWDDLDMVHVLLAAGANPAHTTRYNEKAIQKARSLAMLQCLVAAGEEIADMERSLRPLVTRVCPPDAWELPAHHYYADRYPRFGDRNPELMESPFWREMVKFRWWAYAARAQYQDTADLSQPVWCCHRFGQSMTCLPDGRVVEIAGEHEDYYDPDFCIYNDVIVYDGQGDFQIYGYPRDLFPPTDFHTATLVDEWIYIIGNLGYMHDRQSGITPVYRLNCQTWAIAPVATTGENPGWISSHRAIVQDGQIHISGGEVWTFEHDQPSLVTNSAEYSLDLQDHRWSRRSSDSEAH